MKATVLALLALLALVACAAPSEEPAKASAPCPLQPAPTAAAPADAVVASPPVAPARRSTFDAYPLPGVSARAESAALRAMDAWELASVGAVTFSRHSQTEAAPPCADGVVFFTSISPEVAADPTAEVEEVVGSHRVAPVGGCHYVWLVEPWPASMKVLEDKIWSSLSVDPVVLVAEHELGHAIGLAHEAPTQRSIMIPEINLVKVSRVTCLDVDSLGVHLGRPVRCREDI